MGAADIASSLPDTDDLFKKADPRAAYLARAKSDQEKLNKAATDATTGLESDIAARDKMTEEAKKPGGALAPFEPTPYKPPAPTDPWSNWGSPAMWFAGLSGVIGRRSATRALDAGAAYLNAVNAKDQKLAQQKFDEYKVENENAINAHEWTRDAYKDALEGVKANSADRKAIYETVAHAINDDVMLQALDKGVDHADKLSEERQRHADEMQLHQGEVVKAKALSDYSQAQKDFVAAKAKGDQRAMDDAVARGHAAEQVLTVGQYKAEGSETQARVLQAVDAYKKADDDYQAAKASNDQKSMEAAAARRKQAEEEVALLKGKVTAAGGTDTITDPDDLSYAVQRYRATGALPGGMGKEGSAMRKQIIVEAGRQLKEEGGTALDDIVLQAVRKADSSSLNKLVSQHDAVKAFTNNANINGDILMRLADKVETLVIKLGLR